MLSFFISISLHIVITLSFTYCGWRNTLMYREYFYNRLLQLHSWFWLTSAGRWEHQRVLSQRGHPLNDHPARVHGLRPTRRRPDRGSRRLRAGLPQRPGEGQLDLRGQQMLPAAQRQVDAQHAGRRKKIEQFLPW